jgi:hypothetical protein
MKPAAPVTSERVIGAPYLRAANATRPVPVPSRTQLPAKLD